jgi:hypothetical protein
MDARRFMTPDAGVRVFTTTPVENGAVAHGDWIAFSAPGIGMSRNFVKTGD